MEATGLPGTATERPGRQARRRLGGYAHVFHDVTEQPAPTITQTLLPLAVTEGGVEPLPNLGKPPYAIPSMADIEKLRGSNGYRMASTFSGCGGSCLGFEWAGFDVAWASEFIPAAQDVYRLNHLNTILDTRDIREVTSKEILRALDIKAGELDVFEGSPPCSAFSTAGKRSAGWGKEKKYSDGSQSNVEDLFFEWVRLLDGIKPRMFVAENVAGLNKGVAKGYLIDIIKKMKACGYRVKVGDLDAQWLGVPQRRRRLIFVGVRDDLNVEPRFPTPLPYRYSVADACPWIVDGTSRVYSKTQTGFDQRGGVRVPGHTHSFEDVTDQPHPTIDTSSHRVAIAPGSEATLPDQRPSAATARALGKLRPGQNSDEYFAVGRADPEQPAPTIGGMAGGGGTRGIFVDAPPVEADADIARFAIGKDARNIPEGGSSEKYQNLVRAHRDRPSPTVTTQGQANAASVIHPTELRKFSIAELRRICGFPDDFQLTGSYAQQWERLGRAVPPPMMRAVAETVAGILREIDG